MVCLEPSELLDAGANYSLELDLHDPRPQPLAVVAEFVRLIGT